MAEHTPLQPSVALLLDAPTKGIVHIPSVREALDRIDAVLKSSLESGVDRADIFIPESVEPGGFNVYGLLKSTEPGFCEFMASDRAGKELRGKALYDMMRDVTLKKADGKAYSVFYRFDLTMLRAAAPEPGNTPGLGRASSTVSDSAPAPVAPRRNRP